MLCILCMKAEDQIINIFDAHGLNLNVGNIVTKHFWLQPNEEDPNAKVICCICWNALESFHKFYQEVEQVHLGLFKESITGNNLFKVETYPPPDIFNTYPAVFTASNKVEINEDTNVNLAECNAEKFHYPLIQIDVCDVKVQDIKSESESDIPLSNLINSRKSSNVVKKKRIKKDSLLKKKKQKQKKEVPVDDDNTDKETYEHWPASSYAEEADHNISCKHLDALIESTLKLSCNICQSPLSGYAVLRDHYRAVHNELGYIACCDKKFDKRGPLVDHLLFHKNPEYFRCEICDRKFANRKNLKEHLKGHDKKLIFHCDSCPKSFHRKLLLDRHKDTHISDRNFKCDECGKLYTSKFTLGQHVYAAHKGGYTKVCDQCGKVFHDLEAFRRHLVLHTDEPKPFFSCDKCGSKLASRAGLLRHLRSKHTETDVTHICNICGKVSANKIALRHHITYMHKYERKFKCAMCDKGFKTAIILKPSKEDSNKSTICRSCWQALYSFHEFYEKVEKAHHTFLNAKCRTEDDLSANNHFDTYSDLFAEDIKVEACEEPKIDIAQVEAQLFISEENREIQSHIKSGSDSDVPLGKLSALRKPTKRDASVSDTDSTDYDDNDADEEENDTDYKVPENKDTDNNAAVKREYNKHRIPCKQFDELIKQNMKLSCNVCHISLESFFELKEHYRSAHNKIGYVTCCEKKFDSRHALVHHILMHKDPESYKCMKCGRVLADRRGLKRHMKTTHVNEERVHKCLKCKKGFRRKELLEKHAKTHVRPEVICEQCGKVVRGKQYLKQHQLREHSGIPKQRQQCPKCGVYLADNSTLSTHMKYQHPVVKVVHECHICGKISATGYGLKRHIEYMHTRGRPHKCTLCEKAFKTLKCLRVSVFYSF